MAPPGEIRDSRVRNLGIGVLIVFGVLLGRLLWLQGIDGRVLREKSTSTRIRPEVLAAPRGQILDRSGRVLAGNEPAFDLTLDPLHSAYTDGFSEPPGPERLARTLGTLAAILEIPVERLDQRLSSDATGPVPLTLARHLSFPQRSRVWERLDHLPGVSVETRPVRSYPHGELAAHVLGYLGEVTREELEGPAAPYHRRSLVGRSGIEAAREGDLRSLDGKTYVEVDALGRKRDLYAGRPQIIPVRGLDLVTTLDFDLQRSAEAAFDSLVPMLREGPAGRTDPPSGCVVAMDCRTGGLLALVSRPAFEPGKFIRGLTTEEWERIRTGRHPLLNRALQSRYPPGSVFKSVTALVALEAGVASRSTRLSPCRGSYTLGNRPFGCWKAGGHGQLDLVQGFAQSCDVYFYQIGRLLGFERLTRGARTLGLGRITGIDLEGEEAGWIPDADDYVRLYGYPPGPGVPLNLSIGQGELLLTPLELASFYAALVNGGDLVAPRVVSEVIGLDGRTAWSADETPPARRLEASDSHLALMRELLEEVVEGDRGTARGVRVKGFRLGGKTGTAQNPHGEDHALFVGVGPMDDPRWVVVVVVEEAGHGGTVAAPIARRVLHDLLTSAGKSLASHPGPPAP